MTSYLLLYIRRCQNIHNLSLYTSLAVLRYVLGFCILIILCCVLFIIGRKLKCRSIFIVFFSLLLYLYLSLFFLHFQLTSFTPSRLFLFDCSSLIYILRFELNSLLFLLYMCLLCTSCYVSFRSYVIPFHLNSYF